MNRLRVAIIGVGLIGGSLGLAFKQSGAEELEIIGVDSDEASLIKAVECGAIDWAAKDAIAGASAADIVFLCVPVLQIPGLVEKIRPYLKRGAILTDVGSTKGFLRRSITPLMPAEVCYIGGHPIAGREKSGITAADVNLFRDRLYILTPDSNTPPWAIDLIAKLVRLTGARVTQMEIERHEHSAAIMSHLPHVAAAALVNLLGCYPDAEDDLMNLVGGGFCDTTRIASSNADMWADICLTNSAAITDGLSQLQIILGEITDVIRQGDRAALYAFFKAAKTRRDKIIASL